MSTTKLVGTEPLRLVCPRHVFLITYFLNIYTCLNKLIYANKFELTIQRKDFEDGAQTQEL